MAKEFRLFNINENVRVKLTDHGRTVARQFHDSCFQHLPVSPKYVPPKEDEQGWSVWQMWTLMETFGNHIGMCRENVFELNIEVLVDG